jgi:2-methylcitrate dehydratase PrpD
MSVIEDMSKVVLETRFEDLDKAVVDRAKNRIIDVTGCLIGGACAPGCDMIMDLVKQWGGETAATVLVHGFKAPAHNAAMVNSIMCRSYDFEPIETWVHGKNYPSHISGTTVPSAITMAEVSQTSGKELITALVVGDDLTSRILAASHLSFALGWDGTGTVNVFGATAIAGRLLGLNQKQMVNAFGIALNQMAGSFQIIYDGTHSFKLPMGLASRAGIFSAELAKRGFTGIKDALYSKHGYFNLYCRENDPETVTKNLGQEFFADNTFKPYSACRSTHGAIECALKLVEKHTIAASDIAEIIISVTPVTINMFVAQPFVIGDVPQANASFSLAYTTTNVFLRKSLKLDHFTDDFIRDPRIGDLVKKVKLVAAIPPETPLASRVEVLMQDGRRFSEFVEVPRGDGTYNPLSNIDLKSKFMANVDFSKVISKNKAQKVLNMLETLEEVENVTLLTNELN